MRGWNGLRETDLFLAFSPKSIRLFSISQCYETLYDVLGVQHDIISTTYSVMMLMYLFSTPFYKSLRPLFSCIMVFYVRYPFFFRYLWTAQPPTPIFRSFVSHETREAGNDGEILRCLPGQLEDTHGANMADAYHFCLHLFFGFYS